MPFLADSALCCPLDHSPLTLRGSSLCCANAHSFDIARQGYVNLLAAQDKRSRHPGDSKDMVAARQRFLQAGYYRQIAQAITAQLEALSRPGSLIVDAGCGEGFYLQYLKEHLQPRGPAARLLGFDISKPALQAAAKRFPASWLVASNRNIPLQDQSVDVLLDIFGFPASVEFARVLKPGGTLLRVTAGDEHLVELRRIIYPSLREPGAARSALEGFSSVACSRERYELEALDGAALEDLLQMTPHLFRASAAGKARLATLQALTLTVDVNLELLESH